MSALSIVIITIAAAIHATWNMLAKKAIDVRLFAWLSCLTASVVYAPLAFYVIQTQEHVFTATTCGALAVMIIVHFLGFKCERKSAKVETREKLSAWQGFFACGLFSVDPL